MSYEAIITKIKNIKKHPNADRLNLGTCHGNQVVISLDVKDGDLGIYFPSDGQLSERFCEANNLIGTTTTTTDENGKEIATKTGGMFTKNRRVRCRMFRGEESDGYWCSIESLEFTHFSTIFNEGDKLTKVYEIPICNKYVNPETLKYINETGYDIKMFHKHFDTKQLVYNLNSIKPQSRIIITEKLHGTSQRVGNVLIERKLKWYEKLLSKMGVDINRNLWVDIIGTRSTIVGGYEDGYTGDNYRVRAANKLLGKLNKGETVYYEIVGYRHSDSTIMAKASTDKIEDDNFFEKFPSLVKGKVPFSYGCENGELDIFVYRITNTNEDGIAIELPWEKVKDRCLKLDVKYVPELHEEFIFCGKHNWINTSEEILKLTKELSYGPSSLDARHIKEGVTLRIENVKSSIYKYKSFEFKIIEDHNKSKNVVDEEESN